MSLNRSLLTELERSINERTQRIMVGISAGILDEHEYKRQCGVLQGLAEALSLAKEIQTQIEKH